MFKYMKVTIFLVAVLLLFTHSAFAQTRIYVGNLSLGLKDQDLENLFAAYGDVNSAHITTDKDTERSKGFGFVVMAHADEAQAAITALNGSEVDGRKIVVNEANPSGLTPKVGQEKGSATVLGHKDKVRVFEQLGWRGPAVARLLRRHSRAGWRDRMA